MVADGQGNLVIRDTLHQWQRMSRSKRFVNGPSCSRRLWIFDLNPGLRRPGFITRREFLAHDAIQAELADDSEHLLSVALGVVNVLNAAADEEPTLTPSCAQSAASAGYRHLKQKDRRQGHGFVIGADGTNNRSLLESAIRPRRSALAALDCPSLSVASLCCR